MRSLRWVGFVFSLLIVGVLGGVMAPLPSEAGTPTLELKVDTLSGDIYNSTTTTALTLTLDTCSATETTQGYTACYRLNNGNTTDPAVAPVYLGTGPAGKRRAFQILGIQNVDLTFTKPSLLVADGMGLDLFKLGGLRVVPFLGLRDTVRYGRPCNPDGSGSPAPVSTFCGWGTSANPKGANTSEKHVLTFTFKNRFDASFTSAGSYTIGLRSGGFFEGAPKSDPFFPTYCTPTDTICNPISDQVVYTGVGIFDTATDTATPKQILSVAPCYNPGTTVVVTCPAINTAAMVFTVGGPAANPSLSFGVPLPEPPSLNQLVPYPVFACSDQASPAKCKPEVTETMVVTMYGPDTMYLSNCTQSAAASKKQDVKKVNTHLTGFKNLDNNDIKGRNIPEAAQCERGQCACTTEPWCNGNVKVEINATPTSTANGKTFDFTVQGWDLFDFSIQTDPITANGELLPFFSGIGTNTQPDDTARIINAPTSLDGTVKTNTMACISQLHPLLNPSPFCTLIIGPDGSTKTGIRIHYVADGDTLTVRMHPALFTTN